MSAKVEGIRDLLKNMGKFERKVHEATHKGVFDTAVQVQRTAILSINKQSKGKRYERKGGKYHIASRKGEAPNTDKGRLVGSIFISHIMNSLAAYVYSDLDYAAYLELVKDRPFLRPAIRKNKKKLKANIANQIKKIKL